MSAHAERRVKIGQRQVALPRSRAFRISIGIGLLVCGVLGFLPVIGFWMFPLGLLVLSVDIPIVRRWRRRLEVKIGRWRQRRRDRKQHESIASNM